MAKAHKIARVVWFDIYGEEDWHQGNPARIYKVEAIGRVWKEKVEGITFMVIAPHNSLVDENRFYDLKVPMQNVLSVEYWDQSEKFEPICSVGIV
jgi:hypothetical protein